MENIANTPAQLGQVLRQCRRAQRRTQEDVGATVGLLPKTVANLELSPARSEIGSLLKLLSALDLELVLRPKQVPRPDTW